MHEKKRRDDLGNAADHPVEGESSIGRGQGMTARPVQNGQVEERKGHAVAKTDEGRARRAEPSREVTLES